MPKRIEYQNGQKMGNCTFLEIVPKPDHYNAPKRFASFICECGNIFEASIDHVKNRGDVCKECHYNKVSEKKKFHGESKLRDSKSSKEFNTWCSIKGRCYNIKNAKYPIYGQRGITMCDRWKESFDNFLEDIGRAPTPKHSIDRIDVNGNYCPENCKWSTSVEQSRNRRKSIIVEYNGEKMHLFELAERIGLSPTCLYQRVHKYKMPLIKAISLPLNAGKHLKRKRKRK